MSQLCAFLFAFLGVGERYRDLGFAGGLTPSGESLEILQLLFKPLHRYPWRNFCNPHLQVHRFITLVIIWTKDNYTATEHNIARRYTRANPIAPPRPPRHRLPPNRQMTFVNRTITLWHEASSGTCRSRYSCTC